MSVQTDPDYTINVQLQIREVSIPLLEDALVLGKNSPIGCEAARRALPLLHVSKFEHLELDDDVVGDILVRSGILKKVPQDKLVQLVLRRVKPLMEPDECVHLKIASQILTEDRI